MPAGHPHAVYGQERFKMLLVVVFQSPNRLTMNPLIQYTLTIDSGNTKLHMFKNPFIGYQYRGFILIS